MRGCVIELVGDMLDEVAAERGKLKLLAILVERGVGIGKHAGEVILRGTIENWAMLWLCACNAERRAADTPNALWIRASC